MPILGITGIQILVKNVNIGTMVNSLPSLGCHCSFIAKHLRKPKTGIIDLPEQFVLNVVFGLRMNCISFKNANIRVIYAT